MTQFEFVSKERLKFKVRFVIRTFKSRDFSNTLYPTEISKYVHESKFNRTPGDHQVEINLTHNSLCNWAGVENSQLRLPLPK